MLALCALLLNPGWRWLPLMAHAIYSVIGNFQVLFLDGVENWLQAVVMVVMCEQSCSVLLIEAITNYELEIPEGKSLLLIIALWFLSALV